MELKQLPILKTLLTQSTTLMVLYGRTTVNDNFDDTISTRVVGGFFISQVESGNDSQVPQSIGVYAENRGSIKYS